MQGSALHPQGPKGPGPHIEKEIITRVTRRASMTIAAAAPLATWASTAGFHFVFMPCIQCRPEWGAPEGLAAALRVINALDPQPDFILTGGEVVHDLRALSYADAQARLDAFLALWSATTRISTPHMIGNLEIAGFSHSEARERPALWQSAATARLWAGAKPLRLPPPGLALPRSRQCAGAIKATLLRACA